MNKGVIAAAVVGILAAAGGYWLGQSHAPANPSPEITGTGSNGTSSTERKILYYRNPMGLPDTSPTPKKDQMGMDYIPVYAGEQDDSPSAANTIKISTEKIQKLGVRTEAASLGNLDKLIRAAGRIEPDERRTFAISPKFEGYVERLHVNAIGLAVGKGQALFEVYSPELVSAQREYAIAAQGLESLKDADTHARDGMRHLADASLARLRNWDISEEQIKSLTRAGETRRTLTFRSPVAGIVTEKKALQGMRFMPGEALYQVTDLSTVWAVADIYEQDIAQIRAGAKARVRINAYPDQTFEGTISFVYPTLNAETRTIPVRIDLPNPQQRLKPGMFAQIELPSTAKGKVLTIPNSAVIDSGTRQIVLVQIGEGRFQPRDVKLGARSDDRIEVREGLSEGELVVVAANFLIDAESNLQAAMGSLSQANTPPAAEQPAAKAVGHQAEGKVEEIDAKAGTASITHGPVASLKWPGMTMEFKAANAAVLQQLQPGAVITFEFVERGQGEWVITRVTPAAPAASKANPHANH